MSADAVPILVTNPVSPLESLINVPIAAMQSVRQQFTFRHANPAARAAQTGMSAGDSAWDASVATEYFWSGFEWIASGGAHIQNVTATGTALLTTATTISTITLPVVHISRYYSLAALFGVINTSASTRAVIVGFTASAGTLVQSYSGSQTVSNLTTTAGTPMVAQGGITVPSNTAVTVTLVASANTASSGVSTGSGNGIFTADSVI